MLSWLLLLLVAAAPTDRMKAAELMLACWDGG
jgi:hypothetical protein